MNYPNISKTILIGLCVISMGLISCANKEEASVRVAGRGGAIQGFGSGGAPLNNGTCANNQGGMASLTWNYQSVLNLVSATISPNSFQGICKVNFSANLKFDSYGNAISGSTILIQIVDALVGTSIEGRVIPPYEIQFRNAVNGNYNRGTGQFQVSFSDQYGSFTISGQINGGQAYGKVYFKNEVAVQGFNPAEGLLGDFTMPTSSLLN